MRKADLSGAVVAASFDVIILGQFGNLGSFATQLAQPAEHDFGAAVVFLQSSVNLDHAVLQLADVSDVFEMAVKYDNGKRTYTEIVAKVEPGDAMAAMLDAKNLTGHTLILANMGAGLSDGNAIA